MICLIRNSPGRQQAQVVIKKHVLIHHLETTASCPRSQDENVGECLAQLLQPRPAPLTSGILRLFSLFKHLFSKPSFFLGLLIFSESVLDGLGKAERTLN